ncbi:hypothetical protein BX600DRAFT_473805 [Xylariales sp. PMI_506]|nr:hypothetical protein BX600DRAFT_473805 [Xylariales sp. PMI_506]
MESNSKLAPATQLYGRACSNCARSKSKCVSRPSGVGCERCYRLNKSCVVGESSRKRHARENNAIARIAQLEGKLDDLVSLLGSNPGIVQTARPRSPSPPSSVISPFSGSLSNPLVSVTATAVGDAPPELPADEVEECVEAFRKYSLKYFPFIDLPKDIQWLRRKRPFLLLCIVASSSKDTQRRLALGKDVKQILAQKLILDSHSVVDIDLLLGILTFLSWSQDQLLNNTPTILSRYTQMAMAIVFDLRLNKPAPEEMHMLPVNSTADNAPMGSGWARTLEEKRAVLACYLLSSIVSSYFGQIDAMQWTPYMDDCVRLLSQSRDCPYDELLAHQVQLCVVAHEFENVKGAQMPLGFYQKALQSKVSEIKLSMSPQLQQDEMLLATMYYAELSISRRALSKDASGIQRLECLYYCLNTVKLALDNFFKIPAEAYLGLSFPFFTILARYVQVLYKLSTLNDPAWDTGLVRSTVDLLAVIDRILRNLQLASVAGGVDTSADGLFHRTLRIFMMAKTWCSTKMAERTEAQQQQQHHHRQQEEASTGDGSLPQGMGLGMDMFSFDGLYDGWQNDMFNYGLFEGLQDMP